MWMNYSHSLKGGLTLIEVVGALALLSTLLVGILLAFARHERQIRQSRRTIEVVDEVDKLLYMWMSQGGAVPRDASGTMPEDVNLVWRTETVSFAHRDVLGIDVVRLEVTSKSDAYPAKPIVSLDLPVPSPQWGVVQEERP